MNLNHFFERLFHIVILGIFNVMNSHRVLSGVNFHKFRLRRVQLRREQPEIIPEVLDSECG